MDNKQKSREYWEKRARENENKVYKKAGDLKKNLDEHYIKARREIQKSINDLVARYMDKTELSYVEAMKNLTSSEFKEWKMTLEEYEKEIDRLFKAGEEELANKLRIELETLAMKSRITRLDSLKTQIDIELNRKASRDYDVVKKGISDVYRDFYTITTSDFGLTGVNTVLPDKVLRRLINQPWSGANFSERIWGNAETLGKVLKQEIIQSFIQGISVKNLSDRIQNRFEADRKNTERLVRTELNHALNETTKLSYEEAEIEEYEYLAEIDSRTSDICRELNGQKFKMKDAKVGVNYPPMHPNCRSTTVPVIDYENFGKKKDETKKKKIVPKKEKLKTVKNDIIELDQRIKDFNLIDSTAQEVIELGKEINEKYNIKSFIGDKENLKNIFSNFREMGGVVPKESWGKGSSKVVKTQLEDAFSYYPKNWAEIPKNSGRQLYTKKVGRGYFSAKDGNLTIAATGKRVTTPFHEIGHMVEWYNDEILRITKEWVEKRTKDENPIQLLKLFPKSNYKENEVVKKDDFISPYIGKIYSDATEVLSMGLESLYVGNKQAQRYDEKTGNYIGKGIEDDEEFLNLIIGLIIKG